MHPHQRVRKSCLPVASKLPAQKTERTQKHKTMSQLSTYGKSCKKRYEGISFISRSPRHPQKKQRMRESERERARENESVLWTKEHMLWSTSHEACSINHEPRSVNHWQFVLALGNRSVADAPYSIVRGTCSSFHNTGSNVHTPWSLVFIICTWSLKHTTCTRKKKVNYGGASKAGLLL